MYIPRNHSCVPMHKLAFVPPKPNEFLRAMIFSRVFSFWETVIMLTLSNSLSFSAISTDGGYNPFLKAVKDIMISTAPAAPNKCP